MKKEKKTEEIQFNPADYDYMDKKMPLEGWIWEFTRRGEKYKLIFNNFEKIKNKFPDVFTCDSHVDDSIEMPYFVMRLLKELESEICLRVNFIPDQAASKSGLNNFLIFKIRGSKMCIGIPKPDARYKDFSEIKPNINFVDSVKVSSIDDEIIKKHQEWNEKNWDKYFCLMNSNKSADYEKAEKTLNEHDHNFNKHCSEIIEALSPQGFENTLYLGISKTARIEDIQNEIKKILKTYVQSYRIMSENWKYYLIIFDLYTVTKNCAVITNLLASAVPKYIEKNMTVTGVVDGTILYDFNKADDLVKGEYKKYITSK